MTKNYGFNPEKPKIMFIDLNSAFATTEQQARPLLRGKPMGVTNRISQYCCVIAASYEAKRLGIKVGMNLQQAKEIAPDFIILETDPPKYHHVYQKVLAIMQSYSPNVKMQSIDEGVIDFHDMEYLFKNRSLEEIGYEIKQRIKDEIGDYMTVNVGIAPNRFLAKQAANINKPDGLDVLDHSNLADYYKTIQLTDICGIAKKFKARLNYAGIMTPTDFLEASADQLKRFVFHGVVGEDWHHRLRGWEVDGNPTKKGMVGRQFVLDKRSNKDEVILPRFHYLCETTGKKLRSQNLDARGVLVWCNFQNGERFRLRQMFSQPFYTDRDIYTKALGLFNQRPKHLVVTIMGITVYQLSSTRRQQSSLIDSVNNQEYLTQAIDEINERYGTFMVHSLNTLEGKRKVKQKIPFGSTEYFSLLLKRA